MPCAARVMSPGATQTLEDSKQCCLCRLAREADAMRSRAMELEREMDKLRTGRPMQACACCGHAGHAVVNTTQTNAVCDANAAGHEWSDCSYCTG